MKLPFCAGVFEGSFAKKLVSFFRTAHFPKGIAVFTWPLFFCCGQGVRFFHLQEEFLPASARSLIFRIRRMFFPRSVRTCFYGFAFSCPQELRFCFCVTGFSRCTKKFCFCRTDVSRYTQRGGYLPLWNGCLLSSAGLRLFSFRAFPSFGLHKFCFLLYVSRPLSVSCEASAFCLHP